MQRDPSDRTAGGGGGEYGAGAAGVGAGAAALATRGHPQQHFQQSGPPQHYQQQQHYGQLPPGAGAGGAADGGNLAGIGAGRGAPAAGAFAHPGLVAASSFDPRARDGGWAVAGQTPPHNEQQQQQSQYPPYPPSNQQHYPQHLPSSSPSPAAGGAAALPSSIAYNPPQSSFRQSTDLAPPPSSRFNAYNAPPLHGGPSASSPLSDGISSPVPSYRSIPALGAIGRTESETGTESGVGMGEGGRQLRVVNEGGDPYDGLDGGLRR